MTMTRQHPIIPRTPARLVMVLAAGCAAMALSACASAPASQAPIQISTVSEGAPYVAKSVKSWKDLKFVNVVRQQTDFSCGAAAVATIFNYAYGKTTSEHQVLVNMLKVADEATVREKGFSLLDIKTYVEAIGMRGEGYTVDYPALADLKVPSLVLLNPRGYRHFVVLRKADADYVYVADPALGNRVMSRREFEKTWNHVVFVILADGYDPATVLRKPPPALSARRLFDQRAPIADAEIYDFGLTNAFNFVL